MKKRGAVMLCSLLLLAACGTEGADEAETESTEVTAETTDTSAATETTSVVSSVDSTAEEPGNPEESGGHPYDNLIDESVFTNEAGYQAWLDYKEITQQYTLGDRSTEEGPKGSSSAEIDEWMSDETERAEVVLSETEKMVFYRYMEEGADMDSEMSPYLSEIAFYFVEDQVMFSSVTPTYFEVQITESPEFDTLTNLFTISELEELQPQVFTAAEMALNGQTIQQIMVPSQASADQEEGEINAFYLFTVDDEIVHYAYLPFFNVSQDFPTSSVLVYNSYFSWLQENS